MGNGEIVDAVYLNDFGDLDQATSVCENFYIPQDDYISQISYRYNLLGIAQLSLVTVKGLRSTQGLAGTDDSTFTLNFS